TRLPRNHPRGGVAGEGKPPTRTARAAARTRVRCLGLENDVLHPAYLAGCVLPGGREPDSAHARRLGGVVLTAGRRRTTELHRAPRSRRPAARSRASIPP